MFSHRKYTAGKVRAEAGNVKASLQNIYEPTADIKESEVKDEILRAGCKGCLLEGTFDGGFNTKMSFCQSCCGLLCCNYTYNTFITIILQNICDNYAALTEFFIKRVLTVSCLFCCLFFC